LEPVVPRSVAASLAPILERLTGMTPSRAPLAVSGQMPGAREGVAHGRGWDAGMDRRGMGPMGPTGPMGPRVGPAPIGPDGRQAVAPGPANRGTLPQALAALLAPILARLAGVPGLSTGRQATPPTGPSERTGWHTPDIPVQALLAPVTGTPAGGLTRRHGPTETGGESFPAMHGRMAFAAGGFVPALVAPLAPPLTHLTDFGAQSIPSEPVALAAGGLVPGSGRGDIVPAMLEPGEFVVRRSVAEQIRPALEQLNGPSTAQVVNGHVAMATGGTVSLASGGTAPLGQGTVTTDALLAAILSVLQRQQRTTQTIAQNTGQTTQTLGAIAKDGGVSTPQWIAPPGSVGGSVEEPGAFQTLLNSGLIQSGLKTLGSGASALGYQGAAQTAVGLAGIASLIQGLQNSNPYQAVGGGLTTASALAGLLAQPGIAQALGLTPAQVATASLASQGFAAGTGILGVVQGIQTGNTLQAATGGVQTLSSLSNILASQQAASLLGYSTGPLINQAGQFTPTVGGSFGLAGSALGAIGGGLGLYQGIQNEDPAQIALGAYNLGTGVYGTLSTLYPTVFTPLSTVAADALVSVAPTLAAGLGITGTAGAAAASATAASAAAASGAMGGATGAGVGTGAAVGTLGATLGVGALAIPLVVLAAIQLWQALDPNNPIFGIPKTKTEISQIVANTGINNLNTAIQGQQDLSGLVALLNTQFAPHGEVQMGSSAAFGWAGDYDDPASQHWMQALGALYNPNIVGAGQGMPWVDAFIRGLWVRYGSTGAADTVDAEAIWKLQSKLAMALPNLPAYASIKAAVMPGGDLWIAEQARLTKETQWMQALPTPSYTGAFGLPVTPTAMNTYAPYTDTVTQLGGTTFQLSYQVIRDYGINPYTYDPALATYGPYQDPSSNSGFGGMSTGGVVAPLFRRPVLGRDTEPRLLEPGEWVIPRRAAAGNTARLDALVRTGQWPEGPVPSAQMSRAGMVPLPSEPSEFVIPRRITAGNEDHLDTLVRTGRWSNEEEKPIHYAPMSAMGAAHEQAAPVTQGPVTMPMTISVTINGDVVDPRVTAEKIGAAIRDQLKRIDPRYSRVGNKTQG